MPDWVLAYNLSGDTVTTELLSDYRAKASATYRLLFRGDSAEECALWSERNQNLVEDGKGLILAMDRADREWRAKRDIERLQARHQAAHAIVLAIANIAGGPMAGTGQNRRCKFCTGQNPDPQQPEAHLPHCPYPDAKALVQMGQ